MVLVMGVMGGVLLVVAVLLMAVWWMRSRDRRSHQSTKTVTHIVKKEKNPDLLRMDNTDDSDGEDTTCGVPLKSSTSLIDDTSLELEKVPEENDGISGSATRLMSMAPARSSRGRETKGSGVQNRFSAPQQQSVMVDYPAAIRNYARYGDDPISLYASSSPDVNDRTRLTASVASPATSTRSAMLNLEDSGLLVDSMGTPSSSIGGIGGSLLRGSRDREAELSISVAEADPRRQTTVRLLRSSSPESSC
ncbi:uncharacterized protein LOC108675893 [Hyalella azteca]|uniref:Uncharacterized protein LOC108675893 n=1 Tax=Hyalella azteca TaxID=294128 RepID=A0A8B7P0E4_HYAAZ|nr:uncharacterized protein LOC108675893 [Hyalella azteca]